MSDLNDRIAKAKGWKPRPADYPYRPALWEKPDGAVTVSRPDFTGTLEGATGMLRELGPDWDWNWDGTKWVCSRGLNCGPDEYFWSSIDHPGDCLGEAWMSVFGKELANAL